MNAYINTRAIIIAALLTCALSLIGCREEFDFEAAIAGKELTQKKIEFEDSFKEAFCGKTEIAPDHTWGFEAMMSEESLLAKAMTRGANPNSNEWANTYIVPGAVTADERKVVYDFFKAYSSTVESETVDFSEFFVQQVWHGTDVYKDGYNQDVVGGQKMNQLMAGGEHVNNFNGADGDIMLMVNSNTRSFGYWNSCDGKQHSGKSEYKILYVPGYGWYLGFDFMANGQNPNEKVAADGVYTDWIVKVTPGVFKDTKRVLCEDLGDIGDFDYNDAVFDVSYITDTKARITLRAAGATLPIYIGKFEPEYEVHNLFGVEQRTMVNTNRLGLEGKVGPEVVRKPAVVFEIDGLTSTNPADIPIIVGSSGTTYALEAPVGHAPHKICVPVCVEWTNERLPFQVQYSKFTNWVNDPSQYFWEGVNLWEGVEDVAASDNTGLTETEVEAKVENAALQQFKEEAKAAIEAEMDGDSADNVNSAASEAITKIENATCIEDIEEARRDGVVDINAAINDNQSTPDYGTLIKTSNTEMWGYKMGEIKNSDINKLVSGQNKDFVITVLVSGWATDMYFRFWDESDPYNKRWTNLVEAKKVKDGVFMMVVPWQLFHEYGKGNGRVSVGGSTENYPIVYVKQAKS